MGPDSRIVIPVGDGAQRLLKITRRDGSPPSTSEMIPVRFVPMTGAMGTRPRTMGGAVPLGFAPSSL